LRYVVAPPVCFNYFFQAIAFTQLAQNYYAKFPDTTAIRQMESTGDTNGA